MTAPDVAASGACTSGGVLGDEQGPVRGVDVDALCEREPPAMATGDVRRWPSPPIVAAYVTTGEVAAAS